MKPENTKQVVRRLTDRMRLEELSSTVVICLEILTESHDFKEVSNLTGLSVSTIRRLYLGEYSLKIRWDTVQRLAAASGLKLVTTDYGFKLRLISQ